MVSITVPPASAPVTREWGGEAALSYRVRMAAVPAAEEPRSEPQGSVEGVSHIGYEVASDSGEIDDNNNENQEDGGPDGGARARVDMSGQSMVEVEEDGAHTVDTNGGSQI